MSRTCTKCGKTKDRETQFFKNPKTPDGYAYWCKRCAADCGNATTQRRRQEVIAALGGECVRCHIDDVRVLEIDHINGGGSQHRKGPHGAAYGYYRRMLDNLTPYQLLCRNCNHLKRLEEKEHRKALTID